LTPDIPPPGVLNVAAGPGGEIGKALASNKRIAKIAFNGETVTGRLIAQYASEPIVPQTLELGGKSPNIFKVGNPLDPATMMGPQVSQDQMHKILDYVRIGKEEGANCLTGGARADVGADLAKGYCLQPTVFTGHNKMRIFQEFKTLDEAVAIGNDTVYGLGAAVWSRNINNCYCVGRAIKAGRCWTTCYHVYPGGRRVWSYKESGFGRETHKRMLEHYQQTKNLLVGYSTKAMGFF
jgi:aldehyde dehydrogenase